MSNETSREIDDSQKNRTIDLSPLFLSAQMFFTKLAKKIYKVLLKPFVEKIWKHKLFICCKDFLFSKFWIWVDSAPD